MKILVLGGTGAMGVHLVNLLSSKNIETFVTTRNNIQSSNVNIKYIIGNAHNQEFLQSLLMSRWDAIIDFMVYSTKDFKERVNSLLNATNQYIFLSSSRVYSDTLEFITENTPRLLDVSNDIEYLATDEYALSKARQEDILKNTGKCNWTIIRPYITFSEKRLQLGVLEKEEWLYRALKGRTIIFSKDMLSMETTLTYGLDVSKGIQSIIGEKSAIGETYNITSNETVTWKEVLSIYLDAIENKLGFKPKVIYSDLNYFIKIHPAIYQIKYDRLFNRKFDSSKIYSFIDLSEFTQIKSGLKKCVNCFLENPKFELINWKLEAIKDRLTNEKTHLNEIKGAINKYIYLKNRYL